MLNRLAKLYRPPQVPGGKRGAKSTVERSPKPKLPPVKLVQLKPVDWSERDDSIHDAALPAAKKRRKHPRTHQLDSFKWTGPCTHKPGDIIIQVTDEGGGKVLVAPLGTVLHVRTRREPRREVSFVFLERPNRRQRDINAMAQSLGKDGVKKLRRGGEIRNEAFARALLNTWSK